MDVSPPIHENDTKTICWGLTGQGKKFEPFYIPRGPVGDDHIKFDLHYCGICHSDCHSSENLFGRTIYPWVGGHELYGQVTEVGKNVSKCKVGDMVGVGCMVDSCMECVSCKAGEENYC
jgi:uncharacterized zinc-type alcohol dehydrogenase-like protein